MRIVIFGNSGSGKSSMAQSLVIREGLPHLDLDTVAWRPGGEVPERLPLEESRKAIQDFISVRPQWVIEGCYADLLELVVGDCTELRFLNPGTEVCVEHCRRRPWEPHKYESPEAQNANLEMLLNWVRDYENRQDEFSLTSHRRLFDRFSGKKKEYTQPEEYRSSCLNIPE